MSEMTEAELQDLKERWEGIKVAMDIAWNVIDETLHPIFEEVKQTVFEAIKPLVLYFAEMVQRTYLCQILPRWIPGAARSWLARHWPRALLPELAEAIKWMKAEAMLSE